MFLVCLTPEMYPVCLSYVRMGVGASGACCVHRFFDRSDIAAARTAIAQALGSALRNPIGHRSRAQGTSSSSSSSSSSSNATTTAASRASTRNNFGKRSRINANSTPVQRHTASTSFTAAATASRPLRSMYARMRGGVSLLSRPDIAHLPRVRAVLEHRDMFALMQALLGGDAVTYKVQWLWRHVVY